MQIFKLLLSAVLLSASFSFLGCQGNNSDSPISEIPIVEDKNSTKPIVVLPSTSTTLTTNSQVVQIDVKVYDVKNNEYKSGVVERINPDDVLTGRDIGTFDDNGSVALVNGVATFIYTGPEDLKNDTSSIVFGFYHSADVNTTSVYTINIVPEAKQIVLTDYFLRTSRAKGFSMNLESSESVSYTIFDSKDVAIPDENMKSIRVVSKNPEFATFSDTFGNTGTELTLVDKNNMTVNIDSKKKSGLVNIDVEAVFIDLNGLERTLKETFEVVILSGPPTALSLSYAGTGQDSASAKFIESWVLRVTDKYNNRVNTNPTVSMGLITAYTQSSADVDNVANYLYYPSEEGGELKNNAPAMDTFTAPVNALDNIDLVNDTLVLFNNDPNAENKYKFEASGKWDIENKVSGSVLSLIDDFNGTNTAGLGFAVGNNFRNETCTGNPVVANVYAHNGNSVIDENGTMYIDLEYDYYLVGKSIMMWVNFVGDENKITTKIGHAEKLTLRGKGLESPVYDLPDGNSTQTLRVDVSETPLRYRNANFGYSFAIGGIIGGLEVLETSMLPDHNITDCATYSGIGFVHVRVTNAVSATLTLTDMSVNREF